MGKESKDSGGNGDKGKTETPSKEEVKKHYEKQADDLNKEDKSDN